MAFIKNGDGKIITVLDDENMTEEQKKALKDASKQVNKQSDASDIKNSRDN